MKELPLKLGAPIFVPDSSSISEISFLVNSILQNNTLSDTCSQLPLEWDGFEIIINNFLTHLFSESQSKSDIYNISELAEFLNHISISSNCNIFNTNLSRALLIFLFESAIYKKICPNQYEPHLKNTSHKVAIDIVENLYKISKNDAPAIVGILRSAYYLAQNSEGINDLDESSDILPKQKTYRFRLSEKTIKIRADYLSSSFSLIDNY